MSPAIAGSIAAALGALVGFGIVNRLRSGITSRLTVDDVVAIVAALALFILIGLGAIFGGSPAP